MPTFTTVPLENLLELGARDSLQKDPNPDPDHGSGRRPRHLYISPALHATPEQAPIPEYSSPDPFSFSPYVANHKHRRGCESSEYQDLPSANEGGVSDFEEEVGDNFGNVSINDDDAGFVDTKNEPMSLGIEDDFLAGKQFDNYSSVSAQGDFFDANDDTDLSSDGSRTESELHLTRLTILEEIERRKHAEEIFIVMRSQWERIGNLMSRAGLTFPPPPSTDDKIVEVENDSVDKFFQEVVVARIEAEAFGRGEARAEAEEAAATIVETKDQEILRLRDKLQYYETVNHELSQRKLVEVARRQQERKIRNRKRWIWWSFVGVSVAAVGASFAAYSYMPHAGEYLSSLECSSGLNDSIDHVDPGT